MEVSVLKQVNEALIKFEADRFSKTCSKPEREYRDMPVLHLNKADWHKLLHELNVTEDIDYKLTSVLEYNGAIIARSLNRDSCIMSSDDVSHRVVKA